MTNDRETIFTINREVKGILFIVLGTVLLLYTLNILQLWLNGFFIFVSVALIVYGMIESGVWHKIRGYLKKTERK